MAKSEQAKQLNAQIRILANQEFIVYKEYIANEFINEFGSSYQTVEEFRNSWRKTFEYTQKREDFIKFKTKIFLRMLPANNKIYAHPHFLSVLTHDICNYLSHYIIRKDEKLNVVDTAKALYNELYTTNNLVKYKQKVFSSEVSIARNEKHKAEQQATQENTEPRKRKRIRSVNAKPIKMSQNEERKIGAKSVNARIKEKKKELGMQTETPENQLTEEYNKHKSTLLTVTISVNINKK